ncbi:sensor histidine kinase [Paenibacillus oryzisoli]|uniref:Two-component sensor histidine kinase n=1 Tax=Paenibacillus oryzisoli TaxID=1850517 RepID=A0A198A9U2_9BACL|nr:histidine kinase [Paenibacillus oryzisoli]OAS17836.1 two-component sensor histidine kinase [Paenibacillus oryzisoli]
MKILHISWNSIRFKLVVGLLLVTVPLITLLFYNNFYSIRVVHNQVALSNKNLISLYMGQIDTQLRDAERNLIGLVTSDYDIQSMNLPNSEDEYQLAKHSVSTKLSSDILLYKSIDAFFVYSDTRKDLLDVFKSNIEFAERDMVEQKLHEILGSPPEFAEGGSRWFVRKIGQDFYALRILRSGSLYIGAWVNAKTLLIPLNLIDLGQEGSALLVSNTGELMISTNTLPDEHIDFTKSFDQYYMTGVKNSLLVVGEPSQEGNFSLAAVIKDSQILQNLPNLSRLTLFISVISIALLPLSLFFLRHILLVPLKRLIMVMKRINDGNVNVRIESHKASDEILLVNQTFNHMMAQIEELKIHVYEEQLSKQKAELQHLQLQINPHFFMNSLNILFNLAQVKNYELIQEMTLCLVRYFRFMFQSNLTFVSLREELQHVRNYVRIQELRFPGSLTCVIDVPDFLENIPIPPLVIQSFLENSIKYSVTLEEPVSISVSIDLKEDGLDPYVEIVIRDTGKGFSEHVLSLIQSGHTVHDEEGEHIGIWNVRKRLQLLYGGKASITCFNGYPQGAVVEIKLPYETEI